MKQKLVGAIFSILTENYNNLIAANIPRRHSGTDVMSLAFMKTKMLVHVDFINSFSQKILNGEIDISVINTLDELSKTEYSGSWSTYYKNIEDGSFIIFWDNLLESYDIKDNEKVFFTNAKIQISILWKILNYISPYGIANLLPSYTLSVDELQEIHYEEFSGFLPIMNCHNLLLDRTLELLINKDYIPTHWSWRDTQLPAVFDLKLISAKDNDQLKVEQPSGPRMFYGGKTLSEVWQDNVLAQNINTTSLKNSLILTIIDHELSQSIANFTLTQNQIIDVLCQEKDFYGNPWEEKQLTEKERTSLESLKEQIDKLLKSNSQKDSAIDDLKEKLDSSRERNEELTGLLILHDKHLLGKQKSYSTNKIERLREVSGEIIKETPIIIPTIENKEKFPDCRWIYQCSRSPKTNRIVPSIEKMIREWKEICIIEGLAFWPVSTFIDGLYLLLDGKLIKGEDADPNIRRKYYNALSRDTYKGSSKEMYETVINDLNKN